MNTIKLFEQKQIRSKWDNEKEEWYFSIFDVVEILTDSADPKQYIKKMRTRDAELSSKWGTICTPVEMVGLDGKKRKIQSASTKNILRIIQSIPSPKAEPFKMWLAQVGNDRLEEIADPEKAMQRGADFYQEKGYPTEWITQRLMSIKIRKELTDEWKERGIDKESDYAILTNEMTKAWSGLSIKDYKKLKGLKKENLRDNMTNIELVLNMLAEVTITDISKAEKPTTFEENKQVAISGGKIAKTARIEYEQRLNKNIISSQNANDKNKLAIDDKKNKK